MKNCTCNFKGGAFFAASNSSKGFRNYYDMIFGQSGISKVYIIKGGPGTGKSRFMHDAAEYAESLHKYVEYYNCSSDPDSLDGIIIDGEVAIIDGTAPHASDPSLPGAREEIVNLGAFWNGEALYERYDEIAALNRQKSACFARAYRYLAACGNIYEAQQSLILPCVKHEKLRRYIERIMQKAERGSGYSMIPAITDSVGMKGRVKSDAFADSAEKLFLIVDYYNTAHLCLSLIIKEAQRLEIPIRVSFNPVNPDYPDAVYLCDRCEAFIISDGKGEYGKAEEVVRINMKRFADASEVSLVKGEFRFGDKLYRALLDSACDSMAEAGKYHFRIEEIYMSCMDFESKQRFTDSYIKKIIN